MVYIFKILNDASDVGFDWGTDRTHELSIGKNLAEAEKMEEEQSEWDSTDDRVVVEAETPEEAFVEAPSAGSADCWKDDVWLGVADYLSNKTWAELLNVKFEYTLPSVEEWQEIANIQGEDAVKKAKLYL